MLTDLFLNVANYLNLSADANRAIIEAADFVAWHVFDALELLGVDDPETIIEILFL